MFLIDTHCVGGLSADRPGVGKTMGPVSHFCGDPSINKVVFLVMKEPV